MMMSKFLIAFMAVLAVASAGCPRYNIQVFSRASANAAGLQRIVDSFRNGLGGENNGNSPGPLRDGQRSVCDYGLTIFSFVLIHVGAAAPALSYFVSDALT